jgi:hypothetical protein
LEPALSLGRCKPSTSVFREHNFRLIHQPLFL